MSAYNGQKYIAEQIDSILTQKGIHVELYIRDDGSKDYTRDILREYTRHHDNIHVSLGTNLGAARSFIEGLINAPECDYYSFSDQDDYWEQDKLFRAVNFIRQNGEPDKPTLYYSNLKVSDEDLNIIRTTSIDKRIKTLEAMITRRYIAGCTMMMNFRLREIIKSRPVTMDMLAQNHDSFIVSAAYSTGASVICDPEAHILYRQHRNNLAGSPTSLVARIRKEYRSFMNRDISEARIAQGLIDYYGDILTPEAKDVLTLVAGYREKFLSRMKIFCSHKFVTGDWRLTLTGKVKALLGRL